MDHSAPRMSPDLVDLDSRSPVAVRRTRLGPWQVVEIVGEVDLRVVPVLADVRKGDPVRVVIDLHAVTFMDCAGVGALMLMRHLVELRGGFVRVVAPSSPARRVLGLTRTGGNFREYDTVEAAVVAPFDGGRLLVPTSTQEEVAPSTITPAF